MLCVILASCDAADSETPTANSGAPAATEPLSTRVSQSEDGYQPSLPIVAAFYYPWFPHAWNQSGLYPFSNFTPHQGFYASSEGSVIRQHITQAHDSGIDAFLASWWGEGHRTDVALAAVMTEASKSDPLEFRWAIYYEREGIEDPSVEDILADLSYLEEEFFSRPNYLHVDSDPVLFVYGDPDDGSEMATRWLQVKQRLNERLYLNLKVFPGYLEGPNQPNSWHQYAPAESLIEMKGSVNLSPGFWKANESTPRLERNEARFRLEVEEMSKKEVDFHLITSWNEWGEGTSIEPSLEFGNLYLDILCEVLNPQESCGGQVQSQGDSPYVLVGAGDIADCDGHEEATARLVEGVIRSGYQDVGVFVAGDAAYESGTDEEFRECYDPTWGRFKERTFPAPGNHEYRTPDAAGYYAYFGAAAGTSGQGYYSYDVGEWHVVVINSNCEDLGGCEKGSAQELWLRSDLASNKSKCILAYSHHPRFSSGHHGDNPELSDLWSTLYEFGVEVFISGHDHNYERFAPQKPDGTLDSETGIRQFVVGTGGKSLREIEAVKPNSEAASDQDHGVLKLSLHADSYEWEFISTALPTFYRDSGSSRCN